MKLVFLSALLLIQSQSGVAPAVPAARFQPKNAGLFSFDISEPPRTAFETLGEKANTRFSDLKIVEIPDGVDYEIDEYDGIESIHEKHRSW